MSALFSEFVVLFVFISVVFLFSVLFRFVLGLGRQ